MIFSGCELESSNEKQEDEWGSDEEGFSEEEFFKNSANENLSTAFLGGDVAEFEREVEDMMETVRKLQRKMTEGGGAEEVLGPDVWGGEEKGKTGSGEDDVKASMELIEKMDGILRVKADEERRAKLCRIQAEEESRDILKALPCGKVSNGVKINLEDFIRLLNDEEETESDVVCLENVNEVDAAGDEKKKENVKEEKKMEKKKNLKFVEKNIQLAKCGRGTLSLTDEEKLRIENLLVEAEDFGGKNTKEGEGPRHSEAVSRLTKPVYAIDEETKSVLSRIDEKLEAVAKAQGPEQSRSTVSLFERSGESVCEKNEKSTEKGKTEEKKRRKRLAEINKLLNEMNSVSQEEITPLSEEVIVSLVEESKRRAAEGEGQEKGESPPEEEEEEEGGSPGEKRSQDVISELVSNAKLLMPKFKYRFDDS